MLRIYPVCLAMVREVRPYADRIARFDRDLARSCASRVRQCLSTWLRVLDYELVVGVRAYEYALGEACETLANLENCRSRGLCARVQPQLRNRLNHIIGTLVNVVW